MANPILAPNSTWFTQGGTTVSKNSITIIELKDSYTPTGTVTSSWDASAAKDGSVMAYVEGTTLTISGNGSGRIFANADSSNVFNGFVSIERVNGGDIFDTSMATTFERMFQLCTALKFVDTSTWVTDNVTSLKGMFQAASLIGSEGLDVSNWNTSNVTTMQAMFNMPTEEYINRSLTSLDVSKWDTGKVVSMRLMFGNCVALTELDVSNWDTGKVTDMSYMFSYCSSLDELNVSNWNTSSCTNMLYMFSGCYLLTELDVSNWDTSSCTNMTYMFRRCDHLEVLDVSNWDVSKVTTFNGMFSGSNLGETPMIIKKLDVSKWDTSSCTNMSFMFYGCKGPKAIDVSNWDVSKVTTFDHMTAHSSLTLVNGVGNWKTPAAVNMNAMFHSVSNVGEFDVSNLITDNVTSFEQMFEGCNHITKFIGLENFNTSNGFGFTEMFRRCNKVKELDLSSFDTRKAKDGEPSSSNNSTTFCMRDMFYDMPCLEKITLGKNFSFNGDGTTTDSSHVAVLPTPSSEYIVRADGKWYTYEGKSYAPDSIPNLTAATYYAVDQVEERDYLVKGKSLLAVADSIRAKTGLRGSIAFPEKFSEAIESFSENESLAGLVSGELTGVTIPEGTTKVKQYLFYQDKNIENVIIPDSVTEIEQYAFHTCTNLKLTKLPSNLTTIGKSCFSGCGKITLTSLPSAIKEIPHNCFSDCVNIELTELPEGITKIDGWGFNDCTGLKLTKLPDGITLIGQAALRWCYGCSFSELPSSLVEIKEQGMYRIGAGLTFKKIPASVMVIGKDAFTAAHGLTELTFEGTPTSIDETAFAECINISTINVPWSEGEVANAPWGAINAIINYNYVAST